MADYYDLLGVSRDADADTLKRAYRRMARQYHPDINKDCLLYTSDAADE